jgi:putative hydroxymethylpyrimidine transport system ATP-binding protein
MSSKCSVLILKIIMIITYDDLHAIIRTKNYPLISLEHKMSTLPIHEASLSYGETIIFRHLSMELSIGQWTALLGPSGIGKSSFLRLLAGLTQSTRHIHAQISSLDSQFYQQIAYMAQTDLLLPWLSVLENAILGSRLRGISDFNSRETKEKAIKLLTEAGLASVIHHFPHQLSGGMRQRTALIRTLMEDKPIVLMDEPFSALDTLTRHKLQELAVKLLENKTVLFITHDPSEAVRMSHHIYLMQGEPVQLTQLTQATQLSSVTPRELHDPKLISLQTKLFDTLLKAAS